MHLCVVELLFHQGSARTFHLIGREETCGGVERSEWVIYGGRRGICKGGINRFQLLDLRFVKIFALE